MALLSVIGGGDEVRGCRGSIGSFEMPRDGCFSGGRQLRGFRQVVWTVVGVCSRAGIGMVSEWGTVLEFCSSRGGVP